MTLEHDHTLIDSDPHFTINENTRAILYMSQDKLILVHKDHNSEKYTFEIPREVDGHDMYSCTSIQIHYTNIDNVDPNIYYSDYHEVTDKMNTVDSEGNEIVSFSWTVSDYATQYVGTLSFAIKFICKDLRGKVLYSWSTTPFTGITVSSTIDVTDEFIEKNSEVIDRWYAELFSSVELETNVAVAKIREVADEVVEDLASSIGGTIVSETEPTSENVKVWIKDSEHTESNTTALLEGSDLGNGIDWVERIQVDPTDSESHPVNVSNNKIEVVSTSTSYNYRKYTNLPVGKYDIYTYVNNIGKYMYFAYLTESDGTVVDMMCPQSTTDQKYEHAEIDIDTAGKDLYVMTITGYTPQVIGYRYKSIKIFDIAKTSLEDTLTAEMPEECIVTMWSPSNTEGFEANKSIKGNVGYGIDIISNAAFKYVRISDIGIGSYKIASRCMYSKGYDNFAYLVNANGIVVRSFLNVPSGTDELKSAAFNITATDVINNSGNKFTLYLMEPKISVPQWYMIKYGIQQYKAKDIIRSLNDNPTVMDIGRNLVETAKPTIFGYNRTKKLLNFAWITDCHINGNDGNGDTIAINNLRLFKEISNDRFLDFAATGGDSFTAYNSTFNNSVKVIDKFTRTVGGITIPLYNVKGNHDTNAKCMYLAIDISSENADESTLDWSNTTYYGYKEKDGSFVKIKDASTWNSLKSTYPKLYYEDTTQRISSYQWYTMFQNNVDASFDDTNPTGGYFYKDFDSEKIRVLVINNFDAVTCGDAEIYSTNQITFVGNVFTSLPGNDWGVVVLSHVSIGTSTAMYTKIVDNKDKVICVIHGHAHVDEYSNTGGFNNIGTISGYGVVKDGHIGTANEFAFDIFTIDIENKKIYETRIGRGASRIYSYGSTVNQITE